MKILPNSFSLSRFFYKIPVIDKISRYILCTKLKNIKHGSITLIENDKTIVLGTNGKFNITIWIKNSCFYSRTIFGGSIGNAESYVDNDWDCSSLTDLVRLFAKNREIIQSIDNALVNFISPLQKLFHGFRSNTLQGSKENIKSHYDMGNDFFQLFLDKGMMYSSAIFENPTLSIDDASLTKIKTICDKLELKPSDHLLEIGTGWGSFAIYAAQNFKCKITTTTISREQFNYVTNRVSTLGLQEQITVQFKDYRELNGQFDKLVSIEMIEAVGLNNLNTYFNVCSRLLKPDGIMVIQAITIRDQFYEKAKKSVDFIQTHIFPGSSLPSITSIMNAVTKSTDLIMIKQQDYAEDYAQTLFHWSKNFESKLNEIEKLGYPAFLPRLWKYYFSYCEGGFRERVIGVSQIIFSKPDYKDRMYL